MTPTKLPAEEVRRIEENSGLYLFEHVWEIDYRAEDDVTKAYITGATAEALRAKEREEALKQLMTKEVSWLKSNTKIPGSIDIYEQGFIDGVKHGLYMLKKYSEQSQKQTEGEGE